MIIGLLHLPWWGYVIYTLILTQLTIFSVTIYLHRCQAHRAVTLHPIVSHFFRFWLWMTTGMVTKEWAAVHRKHHAKVETEEDPHSPVTKGIKTVLWEGAELYRLEASKKETLNRYGAGTPDDWIERYIYSSKLNKLGIAIMLAINTFLFGPIGMTIWAIQMAWIPFFAAGVVNGIGHYWGYRNFECEDASRNIIPFGIFIGGEELHNNHHAFGTSAKFSANWWEIDIGWSVIRGLQCLGLAHPKKVIPALKVEPNKKAIDVETLKTLISYRFHVLSYYTRDVLIPALSEEKRKAHKKSRQLLSNAKTILVRDSSLIQLAQRKRLEAILENFQSLKIVYQFKIKLQSIWARSTLSQKELLDALQEWCKQAESTRIEALKRFADSLKTFVPQDSYA